MPPKNKTVDKQKAKIVEDKTFGLKNKNKSAKVNKYIQQVQQQVALSGASRKQLKESEDRKKLQDAKKKAEEDKKAELQELFKVVQVQQKVPFGVDPKTVLCINFKNGSCAKGDKCKLAHDLEVGRRQDKIDLYTDKRDAAKEADTIDTWDQAKLESVVISKHGNPRTTTDIVCKYFLEAIEDKRYGWFWECPNGGKTCKYRHALPPGYVLKAKAKKEAAEAEESKISFEEFIETERAKLGSNLTPVTLESFKAWKESRLARAKEVADASRAKKEAAYRAGRAMHMSGRELFDFNPELAGEDDDGDGGAEDEVFDMSGYSRSQDAPLEEEEASEVHVEEELFAEEDVSDLEDDE